MNIQGTMWIEDKQRSIGSRTLSMPVDSSLRIREHLHERLVLGRLA